jgi:hypothetical protein
VAAFLLKEIVTQMETLPGFEHPSGSARLAPVSADEDPWKDIFPAEVHGANRGMDGAIIDHEDGGIRRCAHCLTEIWQGFCQGCGEAYDVDESDYFSDTPERELVPVLDYIPHRDLSPIPLPFLEGWRPMSVRPIPVPRIDHDESDEEQDAYEDDFINDGEVDYESGHYDEDEEQESDHEHDNIHAHLRAHAQAHIPHYMNQFPVYRQQRVIVEEDPIEISDDDDEEEATIHHYVPRRGRVVHGQMITSEEEDMSEESVEMGRYQPTTRSQAAGRRGQIVESDEDDENEIVSDISFSLN